MQSIRSDERGPEPTLEQSQSNVSSGDLSHERPDGVLRQGAAETASRFRRLSRPFAEEERVSVRLFKVGFLERRGQGETGPAGAVFDVTASHAEDITSFRIATLLLQGRKEQGIHRQGRYMEAVGCSEKLHDGKQFLWMRSRRIGGITSRHRGSQSHWKRFLPSFIDDEG